jgi:hypothetical protein
MGRLSRRLNIAQAKFDPPELEPAGRLAVPVADFLVDLQRPFGRLSRRLFFGVIRDFRG